MSSLLEPDSTDTDILYFDKYNLQFEQIHFEIWTNTIRTIRTNTFSNLDKYISAIRLNTICNLNKYICEILTNTIGNFIGLQAKKLSDQQAAAEEQNATLESFENIERCQDEGQCFQSSKVLKLIIEVKKAFGLLIGK